MATLYHQVSIKASPTTLSNAITTPHGIGQWWDKPEIVRSAAGPVLEFRPGAGHGVLKMKLLPPVHEETVEWLCISTHDDASPASAWTNTRVVFDITRTNGASILDFRHHGWDETSRYFGFCNYQWGVALQKLKHCCETIAPS